MASRIRRNSGVTLRLEVSADYNPTSSFIEQQMNLLEKMNEYGTQSAERGVQYAPNHTRRGGLVNYAEATAIAACD